MEPESAIPSENAVTDVFAPKQWGHSAWALIRSPHALFQSMDRLGGWTGPMVYALAWNYAASALTLALSFLRPTPAPWGVLGKVILFFAAPPLALLGGFFFSAFFFFLWHVMGSAQNYRTAFRVWALLAPLSVVSAVLRLVPFLTMAVLVYSFFLLVVASVRVHGIRPTRAWTVWSLVLAGFLLMVALAGVANALRKRWPGTGGRPGAYAGQGPAAAVPPDVEKKIQEEMARSLADYERSVKEGTSTLPQVPPKNKK